MLKRYELVENILMLISDVKQYPEWKELITVDTEVIDGNKILFNFVELTSKDEFNNNKYIVNVEYFDEEDSNYKELLKDW